MNDYIITASSTADLSKEHFEDINVPITNFSFNLDGEVIPDDLGQSISFPDFYQLIREGKQPTTSQPNYEDCYKFFKKFLDEGKDVIHLTLSSGISGAINSAIAAANDLKKEYPDRKIEVIDSLAASSGYGLLIDESARKKEEGMDFDELVKWIEDNKLKLHHWFFSTDLTSYKRGGRISATSYAVGDLLNICPVLNVNDKGELIPRFKTRGKKAAMKKIIKEIKEHIKDGKEYKGKVYISQSDCLADAEEMAKMIEAELPEMEGKVLINNIGTVIGSHTGPGTVAVFFWGDERED